jgi:hypothetical protein
MDAATRRPVLRRAGSRCEYCRLPQHAVDLTFHVEHIIAKQHGGDDSSDNLCLSCDRCNLHKGPNLTSIDPESGQIVPLFHPRQDVWSEHFEMVGGQIVGKSPVGRATAQLMQMNSTRRRQLRVRLMAEGKW